jgi:hypothetical protein
MSGLNTMIQELQSNLIKDINNSHLPVGVVFFVLKDIFNETERSYLNALNAEKIMPPEEEQTEEVIVEEKENNEIQE